MEVKILKDLRGAYGALQPGHVVDVPDLVALDWIAAGVASVAPGSETCGGHGMGVRDVEVEVAECPEPPVERATRTRTKVKGRRR